MEKKLLLTIVATVFMAIAILEAKATLCFGNGVCHEVSRVQIDGVWHDACCTAFASGVAAGNFTCTDDCED